MYTYTHIHTSNIYITCMYVHYVQSRCLGRKKRSLEFVLIESCHVGAVNLNQLLCKNIKCSFLTTEPSFQPLTY